MNRPQITVVLAVSADGKIADPARSAPTFSSKIDHAHLERQVAAADAVLFGAATLRAHGSAMSLKNSDLIARRRQQQKPEQPIQIVCTRSGNIPSNIRFFQQNIPRWLLTTQQGAGQTNASQAFDELIIPETPEGDINWKQALSIIKNKGIEKLALLGGGELIATLFEQQCLDEFWLTICPVLLGGKDAPTPIAGVGLGAKQCQKLNLLSVETIDQEVFLHYEVNRE